VRILGSVTSIHGLFHEKKMARKKKISPLHAVILIFMRKDIDTWS